MQEPNDEVKNLIAEVKRRYFEKGIFDMKSKVGKPSNLYPTEYYLSSGACYYLEKSLYSSLFIKDKNTLEISLAQASAYTYITIYTVSKYLCKCNMVEDSGHSYKEFMRDMVPLLTLPVIINEWDAVHTLVKDIADSLNAKTCVIERGEYDAYSAWFSVKLLTQFFDIELDKRKPRYPKKEKFKYYQDILDNWDSEDMLEVDKMVSILATLHLNEFGKPDMDKLIQSKVFFMKLYPYEILTWLKLRERAGLKNPKTFSHPLMNTPIAKMFLNIKESLPKPTELPYAKELLEKLKEKCPDVDIPEWLDAEDGSNPIKEESTPPQDNTIIPDDFMN